MCNVASNGYAVYDSTVLPKYPMASSDPLEAVMKACVISMASRCS